MKHVDSDKAEPDPGGRDVPGPLSVTAETADAQENEELGLVLSRWFRLASNALGEQSEND